jgi:hypothetical protein
MALSSIANYVFGLTHSVLPVLDSEPMILTVVMTLGIMEMPFTPGAAGFPGLSWLRGCPAVHNTLKIPGSKGKIG